MANLILTYNGLYAKYPVADPGKITDTILSVYKNSFAEKYVIKNWYENGKLNINNFYLDSKGKATSLNYESLNNEKELFITQVENVIKDIQISIQ